MAVTDPLFAQWLMSECLYSVQTNAALASRWGDTALTTERVTTIANQNDAITEATRQLAFLGGPLVSDEHLLKGEFGDYIGRVITITGTDLGYDAGLDVFVIGAQDDPGAGTSRVTVLRRL